jgi:integrase
MPKSKEMIQPPRNELGTKPSHHYIQHATSDNTRQAYRSDIRHFIAWGGLLPTTPDKVILYLEHHATSLNARTLARRLTALKNWHKYQQFPDPTAHSLVGKTLAGIKNVHGRPKDKASPITLQTVMTMCEYLERRGGLADLRNSALTQLGFFGAFRRSELVGIQHEDLRFVREGVEILIPRSKTDQTGEGQICAIPYGNERICPVTTLKTWLEESGITDGYVFRAINKQEVISDVRLSPDRVNILLKSVAKACGLPDAELYSAHSLRRGFATEASKNGASFGAIMKQGRWKHEGTVLGYIEEGKRFEKNAVASLLKILV